jgi:hypothetical protein
MIRTAAIAAVVGVLCVSALHAETGAAYHGFLLGADLPSVAALANLSVAQAVTTHERPVLLQQLEWRKAFPMSGVPAAESEPVSRITFSFYRGELFKMMIDYDRDRTAGLTDSDLTAAISTTYGVPNAKASRTLEADAESGKAIAQWGDAAYSVILYRDVYVSSVRLIVTATPAAARARTAEIEAIELERREAPQRALARDKKDAEDAGAATEKARIANKVTFTP